MKHNQKQFRGNRIYQAVKGAPRISRYLYWDQENAEYVPAHSRSYRARRYKAGKGREDKFFATLDEARKWQIGDSPQNSTNHSGDSLTLASVVEEWKKRSFPRLAQGTIWQYEKLLRLHFESLLPMPVTSISPKVIDNWLDELRVKSESSGRKRKNLSHELGLLSTILGYYGDYHDEQNEFRLPIRERHNELACISSRATEVSKDLTKEEFAIFKVELERGTHGKTMAALATVQYFQGLRISEVAAIHWEDINLGTRRLIVRRSVLWARKRGIETILQSGFKNGAIKELPLFLETYKALAKLRSNTGTGLVFTDGGNILEYRQLQYAYNKAFERAGLPYRSTHVMRHGGCRNLYNENPDLAVAQQFLGNTSLQATLVYAKRDARALTQIADKQWEDSGFKIEAGGNWVQPIATLGEVLEDQEE